MVDAEFGIDPMHAADSRPRIVDSAD